MSFEKITLQIDQIGKFSAIKYVPGDSNNQWIVFLHGMPGGPLDQLKENLKKFGDLKYPSLTFNYPGLWGTAGHLTIQNIKIVLNSVFEYLNELNPKRVYLFGESFGGLVAVNIVANNLIKIDKVILRSPVTDLRPIMHFLSGSMEYLKLSGILESGPDLFDDIDDINPVFLFHKTGHVKFWGIIGKNDEILPGETMVKATSGFNNVNLELWDNFPHNTISTKSWDKFMEKMIVFLDE